MPGLCSLAIFFKGRKCEVIVLLMSYKEEVGVDIRHTYKAQDFDTGDWVLFFILALG